MKHCVTFLLFLFVFFLVQGCGGGKCESSRDCERGSHCTRQGICVFECRTSRDCAREQICSAKGRCIASDDSVDLLKEHVNKSKEGTYPERSFIDRYHDGGLPEKELSSDGICVNGKVVLCFDGKLAFQGVGACRAGKKTCIQGKWGPCLGQSLPSKEVCDQKDNNCDGQVDNGINCSCKQGEKEACGSGVGQCVTGIKTCLNGTWGPCVGASQPTTEVCDGKDNDCDGSVDETFPTLNNSCVVGKGICQQQGKYVCQTNQLGVICDVSPRQGSVEVCDGMDNDCDGQTDEDTCSTGQLCNPQTGKCEGGANDCTKTGCPMGEQCDSSTKQCQKKSVGCTTDAQCFTGQKCDSSTGKCTDIGVLNKKCYTSNKTVCGGIKGLICVHFGREKHGYCLAKCRNATDTRCNGACIKLNTGAFACRPAGSKDIGEKCGGQSNPNAFNIDTSNDCKKDHICVKSQGASEGYCFRACANASDQTCIGPNGNKGQCIQLDDGKFHCVELGNKKEGELCGQDTGAAKFDNTKNCGKNLICLRISSTNPKGICAKFDPRGCSAIQCGQDEFCVSSNAGSSACVKDCSSDPKICTQPGTICENVGQIGKICSPGP